MGRCPAGGGCGVGHAEVVLGVAADALAVSMPLRFVELAAARALARVEHQSAAATVHSLWSPVRVAGVEAQLPPSGRHLLTAPCLHHVQVPISATAYRAYQ